MQFEIADILAEIGARCRLHTETAAPQRDLVEIERQDFLLAQRLLDPARNQHFAELAGDRVLIAQQDVLGDLLRDRGPADRALVASRLADVVEHCVGGTGDVDPVMAPEGLVLGRKEGVDQRFGKIDEIELYATVARIGADDLAIIAAHHGRQRSLVILQGCRIGQIAPDQQPRDREQNEECGRTVNDPAHGPVVTPGLLEFGEGIRRSALDAVANMVD